MELAWITVEKIIEMFIIIAVGAVIFKLGIIDRDANKKMSGLLLKVVAPAMILMSYQMEFRMELLQGLMMTGLLSLVTSLIAIVLSSVLIRRGHPNAEVERMAVVYSNCGFIGIPLIQGLLGTEGVFFMTAYLTVFNMLIWSHGLMLMCGVSSIGTVLKNLVQPATVAIILGLLFFVLHIEIPEVAANPLSFIGNMNTPLAMLVAGGNLADSNLVAALKRPRTYRISFLKLIAIPLAALAALVLAGAGQSVSLTVLVAVSCPTGAMGTMFAMQYGKDSNYAAELFAVTTILSMVTMPVVILVGGGFL